jgi:hypothetical protein
MARLVDVLWSSAALSGVDDSNETDILAAFAVHAADYAEMHPAPEWLRTVQTDDELLTVFEAEVDKWANAGANESAPSAQVEVLGSSAWGVINRGVSRLRGAVMGAIGGAVSDWIRPSVVPFVARFLGDVLVYMRQQNWTTCPIRTVVADAIRAASEVATEADPLVVVAHSMGGNITYDLLTRELSDVSVPTLVTVGTQVGLFEELKLFRSSQPDIPGSDPTLKLTLPETIGRWVNVFDKNDLVGFEIGSIVDGVEDFSYETGTLLKAHTMYFLQPMFHQRLARLLTPSGNAP